MDKVHYCERFLELLIDLEVFLLSLEVARIPQNSPLLFVR